MYLLQEVTSFLTILTGFKDSVILQAFFLNPRKKLYLIITELTNLSTKNIVHTEQMDFKYIFVNKKYLTEDFIETINF